MPTSATSSDWTSTCSSVPAHASVSRVLAGDGRRVVLTLNEVHHLAASDPALVTC